ncbi:MAG: AzlC family ABC transporter permease [Coriobacteriia bacterium]|nr:AzlC family ABC transporter permease [Coriobacteriia bacterium]
MSRTTRSLLAGARDASPIALGIAPFGLVAGAAVVEAGFEVPEAVGMSLLVNAGAAQLAATALFREGAPLLVAIGTALVVNARFLIYAASIAPVLAPRAGRLRPLLGHMLVDQSYAATMTVGRHRDVDVVPYYAGTWLLLASVWQVTNIAGALGGALVPAGWSLDFAVPLVFLAMLVPALEERADTEAALATAAAAAFLVPVLPMQTGLLAAIVTGVVWGAFREPRTRREHPAEETRR